MLTVDDSTGTLPDLLDLEIFGGFLATEFVPSS